MRFLITAQPNPESPAPPTDFDPALFKRYMAFNEELHRAGVLIACEGLNPAAQGGHAIVKDGKRVAVDGPYAETKELVGGFYLIEVPSLKEALAWAAKAPTGMGFDDILEVRPLTGAGDIPPELHRRRSWSSTARWRWRWRTDPSGASSWSMRCAASRRSRTTTCCRACAETCSRGWGGARKRAWSSSAPLR